MTRDEAKNKARKISYRNDTQESLFFQQQYVNLINEVYDGLEAQQPKQELIKPVSDESNQVALCLYHRILTVNPSFKKPNLNGWSKDIDKAIRLDNRTVNELVDCINWIYEAQEGAFWIPNIMSGKKLREKFDQLSMQKISKAQAKPLQSFKQQDKDTTRSLVDTYLDSGMSLRDNNETLEVEVIVYDN